jgi:hypothetical protein
MSVGKYFLNDFFLNHLPLPRGERAGVRVAATWFTTPHTLPSPPRGEGFRIYEIAFKNFLWNFQEELNGVTDKNYHHRVSRDYGHE